MAKPRPCLNRHPTDVTVLCHSIGSIGSATMSPVISRGRTGDTFNLVQSLNIITDDNVSCNNNSNEPHYQSSTTWMC